MTEPAPLHSNSFTQSWRIQCRVVWALLLREIITRFGRHNIGVLWLLVEPLLFVLGVAALWSLIDSKNVGVGNAAEFAAVSYSTVLLWRNPSSRMVKAVESNQSLLYHRYVRPMDFFWARLILEFGAGTAGFVLVYLLFLSFGIAHTPHDTLTMTLGWALIAWFSFGFSLFTAAISELSEAIEKIWHVVLYFMLPISGSFFPAYVVPTPYRDYLLLSPLVDATEFLHSGYYGPRMPTYYHMQYLIIFNALLTAISLSLVRIVSRRVQPE